MVLITKSEGRTCLRGERGKGERVTKTASLSVVVFCDAGLFCALTFFVCVDTKRNKDDARC